MMTLIESDSYVLENDMAEDRTVSVLTLSCPHQNSGNVISVILPDGTVIVLDVSAIFSKDLPNDGGPIVCYPVSICLQGDPKTTGRYAKMNLRTLLHFAGKVFIQKDENPAIIENLRVENEVPIFSKCEKVFIAQLFSVFRHFFMGKESFE